MLHSPIVLFTSIVNLPILVLTPSHEPMDNPQPIHLTFVQHGAGHYDLAIHSEQQSPPECSQLGHADPNKCTCGRKKQSGAACTSALNKYTCRCPCYNTGRACTELCKCKYCQNPFGAVRVGEIQVGVRRKRRRQEAQHIPIRGIKTSKYMDEAKVHYVIGSPTDFERLLVLSILHYLICGTRSCDEESTSSQVELVSLIFHNILSLAKVLCVDLPLFQRSINEVLKMIKSYNFKKVTLEISHVCSLITAVIISFIITDYTNF